jgi:hypothetical protein
MADAYALVERWRRPLGGASPLAVYAVVALVAIGMLLAGTLPNSPASCRLT